MVTANAHSTLRNFVEREFKKRVMGLDSIVVASVDRIAAVGWQGKLTATESQPAAPVDRLRFDALVELRRALGKPDDRWRYSLAHRMDRPRPTDV
jgi:hypothetical protein